MFREPRPLLDDADMSELKHLARDGFATVMAMSDPPQPILVYRYWSGDEEPSLVASAPKAVIGYDNSKPSDGVAAEPSDTVPVTGTLRIPEIVHEHITVKDVIAIGDRVHLNDGRILIVIAPEPYERFGVVRARWKEEQSGP